MPPAPPWLRPSGVFDEVAFDADMKRMGAAVAEIARKVRRRYEAKGVPISQLRGCVEEGDDGTILPRCVKVYLPEPAGRFGMVFQLLIDRSGSRLYYLAFGARHHPRDSNAPTVYLLAHQRLLGQSSGGEASR